MATSYNHYLVFVSSPSDVSAERRIAVRIVHRISESVTSSLRLTLTPKVWEQEPPEVPHLPEQTLQDRFNKLVRESNVFILVMGKRYGSRERGHKRSNTERELDEILAKKRENPETTILVYMKSAPPNADRGPQERLAIAFRKRLLDQGINCRDFADETEFERALTHDLYALAIRMRTSQFKIDCLSQFLAPHGGMYDPGRDAVCDFAIIYRPVLRKFEDQSLDPNFWHTRLMPNVIFEDSKAIQKLQKLTRMLGYSTKVYMVYDLPNGLNMANRIWICAPRMERAMDAAHAAGASFAFHRTDRNTHLTT